MWIQVIAIPLLPKPSVRLRHANNTANMYTPPTTQTCGATVKVMTLLDVYRAQNPTPPREACQVFLPDTTTRSNAWVSGSSNKDECCSPDVSHNVLDIDVRIST